METLRADMRTVLANQAIILQQQQTMQAQLAQLLAFHQPPPPPPQCSTGESLTLCVFILPVGTLDFLFGGGVFCYVLFFVVLVLVVYSIVSCSHMSCVLFLVLHAVVGSV